jgi:hypothetical protein
MKNLCNILLKRIKIDGGWVSVSKRKSRGTFISMGKTAILLFGLLAFVGWTYNDGTSRKEPRLKVGAYYFDGWSGQNPRANDPNEPWAKNAPTHLTRRLVEEFSEREPVWGWRDDSQAIMERQIDLAADNGIEFFLFCWYWRDDNGPINPAAIENLDLHTSLNLYMKAKNKNRIKFGLLVANHQGAMIKGTENWLKAAEYWMQYFKDPQYITVDGKPLVVIFDSDGIDNDALTSMQGVSKKQGLQGLSIAGCWAPEDKNFSHRTHYNIIPGYSAGSEEHKYVELVNAHKKQWMGTEKQPFIPEITVGWDKRPWEGMTGLNQQSGWYYSDRTPEQFKIFLKDAIIWMDKNPTKTTKERIVLVYAWNELGEGGYLVPTKGDPGASYLKVIKSVVSGE